jgi:radical SAM superfamily enzyme YgiQ (UPF0313 family)
VKAYVQKQLPQTKTEILRCDIAYVDGVPGKNDLFRLSETAVRVAESCAEGARVIVFLDNIVWTLAFYWEGALFLGRMIKRAKPSLRVGLQSYKIPDAEAQRLLGATQEIDFIVRGEPEDAVHKLSAGEAPEAVAGVCTRGANGVVRLNPEGPLRQELDELPSPYLTGAVDGCIHPDLVSLATARGCPYQCHFCHRSVRFPEVRCFSIDRVMDELAYLRDHKVRRVFVLDDCFVVSKKRFVDMVKVYADRFGSPAASDMPRLDVMCRTENLDERLIGMFPALNVGSCQIGLQTVNPDAQYLMGRRATLEHIQNCVRWLKDAGVAVQLDVILGLPHDSRAESVATLDLAASMGPARIQVKQLYKNSNTLIDLHPEKYGLTVEKKRYLYHVPYFASSNTMSNDDIRHTSEHANTLRYKVPGTRVRLWSQFHQFSDFETLEGGSGG